MRSQAPLDWGTHSTPAIKSERSLANVAKAWFPLVRRMLGRTRSDYHVGYTPDELELTLYDPECREMNNSRSKLLNVHEIISLPDGVTADEVESGVIRFNTDWRAKAADTVMLVSVCLTIIVTPVTTIWDGKWDSDPQVPGGVPFLVFDMMLDCIYIMYLVLQLNMSYLHPTKRVEVVDRDGIRGKWARNPLYWMRWATATTYIFIWFGAKVAINHVKLLRVLHLMSMPDSLWRLQDKSWVRLLRPIILLLGGAWWVAALLYCYGGYREAYFEQGPEEFATNFNGDLIYGSVSLYLMAFVEALYMLTGSLDNPLGDGSIRDKQFGSLVLVSLFGPIGTIVMSLFISSVVRQQSMAYSLDMRHEENKAFMSRALRILDIPKALQWRVLSMHYYQRMGHDVEAFNELFSKKHMSPALENSLLLYLYRDTVLHSEYFAHKEPTYIIEVLRCLQFQVYLPGDYIARRGEIATVMYFVSKGLLAVLVPRSQGEKNVATAKKVAELQKGDTFGEVGLLQLERGGTKEDQIRTAWVRADTYSLVSALPRDAIEPVWEYFPAERKELARMVLETKQKDMQRNATTKVNKQRWRRGMEKVKLGVDPENAEKANDGSNSTTASGGTNKHDSIGLDDVGLENMRNQFSAAEEMFAGGEPKSKDNVEAMVEELEGMKPLGSLDSAGFPGGRRLSNSSDLPGVRRPSTSSNSAFAGGISRSPGQGPFGGTRKDGGPFSSGMGSRASSRQSAQCVGPFSNKGPRISIRQDHDTDNLATAGPGGDRVLEVLQEILERQRTLEAKVDRVLGEYAQVQDSDHSEAEGDDTMGRTSSKECSLRLVPPPEQPSSPTGQLGSPRGNDAQGKLMAPAAGSGSGRGGKDAKDGKVKAKPKAKKSLAASANLVSSRQSAKAVQSSVSSSRSLHVPGIGDLVTSSAPRSPSPSSRTRLPSASSPTRVSEEASGIQQPRGGRTRRASSEAEILGRRQDSSHQPREWPPRARVSPGNDHSENSHGEQDDGDAFTPQVPAQRSRARASTETDMTDMSVVTMGSLFVPP